MKLWVDDFRDAPDDSWYEVRKVQPAINMLSVNLFDEISLDHDIENRPDDETFQPVAHFIGCMYLAHKETMKWMPKITIHSDNPVGAKSLQAILRQYGLHNVPWEPFTSNADFKKKYGL